MKMPNSHWPHALRSGLACMALAGLAGCAVGPDYRTPSVELPTHFKEGADWQRGAANPQAALSSRWWKSFGDAQLTHLVDASLNSNQSIIAAEAAYRLAQAQVEASEAGLFPVVTAGAAGSRSGFNASSGGVASQSRASSASGIHNAVSATATASWEPDLWGQVRRAVESSQASEEASDALLAGERLSIAASVATDYLALRQFDFDIASLEAQKDIDEKLLEMTHASYLQGTATNDSLLVAEDTLETVIVNLQTAKISREQFEHALAVLTGVPPTDFGIAPEPRYAATLPSVPLSLPSTLLERRPDIVAAERQAAAANAKIGVAKAAFFPSLTLSATGGFASNTLAHLFSLPNRIWTLGPDLAATLFDAGARTAAVRGAEATYDSQVAMYRGTVLAAFQSVEDSLSAVNHQLDSARAFESVYRRNVELYASVQVQRSAGTASEQSLLTQQLTLLTAEQSAHDARSQAAQSIVALIKNLGGGWQEADMGRKAFRASPSSAGAAAGSPTMPMADRTEAPVAAPRD